MNVENNKNEDSLRSDEMNKALSFDNDLLDIDHSAINAAIDEGTSIVERRSLIRNNVLFVLVGTLLFAIAGILIAVGYDQLILMAQIVIVMVSPIIVPFAIRRQIKGGI